MLHLFVLWLSIRGRYNFTHLARYGTCNEGTYRSQFSRPFDFLAFNTRLVLENLTDDRILAFDPSYLPKSGHCTDGVGKFWSGGAGQVKHGMELSGIAAVDLTDKTALHVLAIQTYGREENETLLDYYASCLTQHRQRLLSISTYVVADAYFSKKPFVDQLKDSGFELTSRLRTDVYLRYLFTGPHPKRRGRRRQYAGRVKVRKLDAEVFSSCGRAEDGSWIAYTAVVNVRSWKRSARVVIVHDLDAEAKVKAHRIYVSTDVELRGERILHQYQSRFQQEFLYRDAKQELGLEHCQAYSWQKIDFHINTALTVGSLAKIAEQEEQLAGQRTAPFSIADVKTRYVNAYQGLRILTLFGVEVNEATIRTLWSKVTNFGLRRA